MKHYKVLCVQRFSITHILEWHLRRIKVAEHSFGSL